MKKVFEFIIAYILKIALWLRYRIKVEGLDKLTPEVLNKKGGVLFLPNHPTYFIDPIVAVLSVWPRFSIRPMIIEYMYYAPGIHWLMKFIDALPIPNFVTSSNSLKRKRSEQVFQTIIDELKHKKNFLVYPGGKVKYTEVEAIGGASGVHRILQEAPEANVVLVRIKGLWGSSFSRALTGKAPSIGASLKRGLKIVLKNLIFFTPRREVIIELVPAPSDFPYKGSRLEVNKYLENWYNRPDGLSKQKGEYPGESLVLVSYSMWGENYLPVIGTNHEKDREIQIQNIPKEIQDKVTKKISDLTEYPVTAIKPDMLLSTDLGLDSLDIAELIAFLQDQFDVSNVPATELTTVSKLMAIAAKQYVCKEESEEETVSLEKWNRPIEKKFRLEIAEGETIPEVFLNNCVKRRNAIACADMRMGVQTYDTLKLRVILLARYIQTLPGKYIGILLPASVAANMLILATQLAGKVPLMVNWTVGPRHLESVSKLSKVQAVLTSWAFLDRLENVDFNGIEDNLIMLEDVVRKISLRDKVKGFLLSKQSTKSILKSFKFNLTKEDEAVLLFTSGTESMPKGVPLSHDNLLSNQRAALKVVDIYSDDVLLGILPPFHSFGFTVSGLLALISGCRIAYSPDPTDGKRLARAFERWGATIMCGAPTFIKGMLKAATPAQLKTMRLCVTGAEKAPPDLIKLMEQFGKADTLVEGYGITECAPVLTLNPVKGAHRGVGKSLPGIQLCVVNPETEKQVPNGTQGLVLAKGPNVFAGYLNPDISSPFINLNGEKWYKTGDLGVLDDEGYLTLSGRMKRFIKIGGEMISLATIEDALLQSALQKGWPQSVEGPTMAICAKEIPGEKSKIFLFTKFEVSVEDINKTLKESGLSNLARVTSVTQVPEIPVMGTGKINYRALESEYLSKMV